MDNSGNDPKIAPIGDIRSLVHTLCSKVGLGPPSSCHGRVYLRVFGTVLFHEVHLYSISRLREKKE